MTQLLLFFAVVAAAAAAFNDTPAHKLPVKELD